MQRNQSKSDVLRYCRYQLEVLFVRASLAEPGTRSALISDWHQVKVNKEYIRAMTFAYRNHKRVHFLDAAA